MKIELRQMHGFRQLPGKGRVPNSIPQDEILVDGVRVGYVGHGVGKPINLLGEVAESIAVQIRAVVDERDGGEVPDRRIAKPPPPLDDEFFDEELEDDE